MRIAIFSDNFYPEMSGISDSIISLAKELAGLGHKIDFYAPEYGAKDFSGAGKELNLGKNIKINRLFSLPAPFVGAKARLVLPTLLRLSYKNFKAEIIHSQLFFGIGLEAMALAKHFKIPLIGTNHTAITQFVPYGFMQQPSLKYAIWYYNHCDFVTAPSQSVFSEMEHYGFKQTHQVVSNPLDTKVFQPLKDKNKYKKQFKLTDNTVVYAGRISREKNIEVIIKAIAIAKKKISNINFAVAGAGNARADLEKLVEETGLKNEVKFLGALSHEKVAQLYSASEVFTIASTSETQSLVLMQALACGLPAVAVNSRALPEYVNGKNGYIVKVGDAKAMANKFILLLRNDKLRAQLGQGAYDFVRQFSAPAIGKTWETLYRRVIKNYRKKP